jgi:hypothetical protein
MFRFHRTYFLLALLLLVVEIFIALFVHDGFVRPYAGDFLVVIFLYCVVRSVTRFTVLQSAVGVLLFAYLIETAQAFQLVKVLQLEHIAAARIIIGNAFEWKDMLAYTLGIAVVLAAEKSLRFKK